ncbi:MAG: Gfo/Idh/MocA family oxidoreductase [Planctomycetes bacterium]|nr:Gfo/Idh/MocA family oxidoreductase [Planctomycetota bacterium]
MIDPTRRDVLISGAAAFLAGPILLPSTAFGRGGVPANDKIGLGLIGAGGMGSANLRQCLTDPGAELVAVCDVQQQRVDAWTSGRPGVKGYRDFRELLADPRVDAVIVATPPHWHCLQAVAAAAAGKHVYLQKPMTLYPAETLAVRNAMRRHRVVCQVGTQIHQEANYRRVVDWVRSGRLGAGRQRRDDVGLDQGRRRARRRARGAAAGRHRLRAVARPGAGVRVQPPAGRRRRHALLVDGLLRRLDAGHGAAPARPAGVGAGARLPRAGELLRRLPRRWRRRRRPRHPGHDVALPRADHALALQPVQPPRLRVRQRRACARRLLPRPERHPARRLRHAGDHGAGGGTGPGR